MRSLLLLPALLFAAFTFAGCAQTDPVHMTNPNTGVVAQCGPYTVRGLQGPVAAAQHEAQCIQDFKEQGFIRVAQ